MMISHLEFMLFGSMIVFFLIVEPHGLARLWATAKEKLLAVAVPVLRPFPAKAGRGLEPGWTSGWP